MFYNWGDVLTAKDDASLSASPVNKIYKYKVLLKGIGAVPLTGPVWCVQDGRYCLDWNSLKPMCVKIWIIEGDADHQSIIHHGCQKLLNLSQTFFSKKWEVGHSAWLGNILWSSEVSDAVGEEHRHYGVKVALCVKHSLEYQKRPSISLLWSGDL